MGPTWGSLSMASRLTASSDGLLSKGASIDSLDDETEDTLKVSKDSILSAEIHIKPMKKWNVSIKLVVQFVN